MGDEGEKAVPEGRGSDPLRGSGSRRASDRDLVANATTMQSGPSEGSPPELEAGSMLSESYRVEECIGRGAMGAVYLVTHVGLGKKFAAKVVTGRFGTEPAALMRLRNEARAASAIEHENIVNVTDLGQTGGKLFVIMELLRGQDLRGRLEDQLELSEAKKGDAWLPDDLSRDIVDQVLSALEAAHAAGIVHRDLKPENIFLATRPTGVRAKIVDFGISKLQHGDSDLRLTATGQIIGTPLYMAPEQSQSTANVDHRADIYSMGMIAYEMLTASLPFKAANLFEIVLKHATEEPEAPTAHRPDLPAPVAQVILRCLAKDPAARFQTASELREAWAKAWQGVAPEKAPARKDALADAPIALPTKSMPMWPIALLGAVLVGGAVAYAMWPDPEPARTPLVADPEPQVVEAPREPEPQPIPEGVEPAAAIRRTIHSTPEGATVLRDGREIGVTPLEIELAPGEGASIEVRHDGYRADTRTITEADPPTIEIALRRERARGNADLLAPR